MDGAWLNNEPFTVLNDTNYIWNAYLVQEVTLFLLSSAILEGYEGFNKAVPSYNVSHVSHPWPINKVCFLACNMQCAGSRLL